MRIIAGSKKGMGLLSPKTSVSRPVTDRVKESLFSVLCKYDMPVDKRIADLFSGVGSLGLEALSRGADFATFVEKDPKVITVLNKNIRKADYLEQSKVIPANALNVGAPVDFDAAKYDLVFIDPPYRLATDVSDSSPVAHLLNLVSRQITPEAIVVIRTHKNIQLLPSYGRLQAIERRNWSSMAVTFLTGTGNDK